MSTHAAVIDKRMSMDEAAMLVQAGNTLALGGITIYRRPVAFVKALLARHDEVNDLTLLSYTGSYESDLLIGAGMVSAIRSCYVGMEIFGLAPMFTRRIQSGDLRMIEESEASLAHGIKAHLAGVSFMPGLGWIGTDMLTVRPDVCVIEDPYNPGEHIVAFPAIAWDVVVIHALEADPFGNAIINNNPGVDRELSLGSGKVIITTERIAERFEHPVDLIGDRVEAVVHAPRGATPTSCHPEYPVQGGDLLRYIDMCNANRFEEYLAEILA